MWILIPNKYMFIITQLRTFLTEISQKYPLTVVYAPFLSYPKYKRISGIEKFDFIQVLWGAKRELNV